MPSLSSCLPLKFVPLSTTLYFFVSICSNLAKLGTAFVTFKDPKALEIALLLSVLPQSSLRFMKITSRFFINDSTFLQVATSIVASITLVTVFGAFEANESLSLGLVNISNIQVQLNTA